MYPPLSLKYQYEKGGENEPQIYHMCEIYPQLSE